MLGYVPHPYREGSKDHEIKKFISANIDAKNMKFGQNVSIFDLFAVSNIFLRIFNFKAKCFSNQGPNLKFSPLRIFKMTKERVTKKLGRDPCGDYRKQKLLF